MAKNTFGQEIMTAPIPMEAGGEIEEAGGAKEPEEMESDPTEVKFYADISQKFSEIAAIIADHGKWHESLGKK